MNSKSLGRSLTNSRDRLRKEHLISDNHSSIINSDFKNKNLDSVTEETSLEEFLEKAELARHEFAATRFQAEITNLGTKELITGPTSSLKNNSSSNVTDQIKIPRRPKWNVTISKEDQDEAERDSFLEWKRNLALFQQDSGVLLTPYEKNIEVWRQLWRVVERSDVVVQVLDARNPLLFRCPDLELYVKELSEDKENILILNKADLLTESQRRQWLDYWNKENITAFCWSGINEDIDRNEELTETKDSLISKDELISYFETKTSSESPVTIGLVGYPNVGKSSTINKIMGTKKVAVSATPGKTRHLQTLQVNNNVTLCDCPGLVVPSCSFTREDMIVSGILPVSQLRGDATSAIKLLISRFPQDVWEKKYRIKLPNSEEVSGEELLNCLAFCRGYMSSKGIPDASRAARDILNDVINGKLCWVAAPPGIEQDEFNDFQFESNYSEKSNAGSAELFLLQQRKIVNKTENVEESDKAFFSQTLGSAMHMKGRKGDLSSKKHGNKNKREKLKRVHKELNP